MKKFKHGGGVLVLGIVLAALLAFSLVPANAGFLPGTFYYRSNYYGEVTSPSSQIQIPGLKKHDDGSAEIFTGSELSGLVITNRFTIDEPVYLSFVSFYSSSLAIGQNVEVIIYFDVTGTADSPNPSMEVLRLSKTIEELPGMDGYDGQFQKVSCGNLLLGARDGQAAFFVGIQNVEPAHYSLGIDMSGPKADASYVSEDSGQTYEPLSEHLIIYGNAMIRAFTKKSSPSTF